MIVNLSHGTSPLNVTHNIGRKKLGKDELQYILFCDVQQTNCLQELTLSMVKALHKHILLQCSQRRLSCTVLELCLLLRVCSFDRSSSKVMFSSVKLKDQVWRVRVV